MIKQVPNWFNYILRFLILYTVVMVFVEIDYVGSSDSVSGHPFFLWSERIVAFIFTLEFIIRARKGIKTGDSDRYPVTLMGGIDLLAIIPFWAGFFVPVAWLGVIRSLRILRLLKLYRYSKSLQSFVGGLVRAKRQLGGVTIIVAVTIAFSAVAIYEFEKGSQPENFGTLTNCVWYTVVTLTTVGYGDISPITPGGKFFAQFMMLAGLGIMASFIGVVGGAVVAELEDGTVTKELEKDLKGD